jgi:Asp-tRNA(Asn)/Glu-tRNA(Gln) amidotransferase A subunit family amidase
MATKTDSASRRRFLKIVPVAVAGAVASKALAQGRGGQQNPGPVTTEMLKAAETIDGVDFSAKDDEAALRGVDQDLNAFTRLRGVNIPQDTEPAYVFDPALPGDAPKGPATPGTPLRYAKPPVSLKRPANLEDVAFWPVTSLAALLERKLVTSTELTKMYLARLKRYQPTLNFYVTLTEDLALQQAAAADREIGAGHYRGPLHGIPWGAKDLFATKGIPTTWGAEPYEHQIIDYDATIVERLRDAGAVLVAKLTLGALAMGDQWFGGRTNNPWQTDPKGARQGSSGSSAGPGSATSAGCVGFGVGTETRGSIISPSSVNGVVGLRPTYGRVSRYGAMALSTTQDKVGPLCRYVQDAVLVLNAIYGPDKRDGSVANAAFHWNPVAPLSGYKIAYIRDTFENTGGFGGFGGFGGGRGAAGRTGAAGAAGGAAAAGEARGAGRGRGQQLTPEQQAEIRKMYQDILDTYTKLGAKLEPVDLPDLSIANMITFTLNVEASASFDDITRSGEINQLQNPDGSRSSWPDTFRVARFVPAVEYIRAMRARTILMRQMHEFMSTYDAVLSAGRDALSTVANLTGQPAIAVKCGFFDGLPRPLVITGRLYQEATIARVALAYEQATPWKDRHPPMNWQA